MNNMKISLGPRITAPEVATPEEAPVTQQFEQQSPTATSNPSSSNSIRSEAMFSGIATRAQLTQRLAENESLKVNLKSLRQLDPMERKAALTDTEAKQQVESQPTYRKLFDAKDAAKGKFLDKTLYTGEGDDIVEITRAMGGRVVVNVNGKEIWTGSDEEFDAITVNTGGGNDFVESRVEGAKIDTGDGNDRVTVLGDHSQVRTGTGNDRVEIRSNNNEIDTEEGDDLVTVRPGYMKNSIRTGSGDDIVYIHENAFQNDVQTGDGNDFVMLREHTSANDVDTGEGKDTVENRGMFNDVDGNGNAFKDL